MLAVMEVRGDYAGHIICKAGFAPSNWELTISSNAATRNLYVLCKAPSALSAQAWSISMKVLGRFVSARCPATLLMTGMLECVRRAEILCLPEFSFCLCHEAVPSSKIRALGKGNVTFTTYISKRSWRAVFYSISKL